jgi:septal ring factor EnvC (AmiA/AmiB activator)
MNQLDDADLLGITDDILVTSDIPALNVEIARDAPAPPQRTLPAPHFCADRLFSLAEYLKWQHNLEDDAKLCKHAAIEIKGLRQALREAAQGVKAMEEENKRLKYEVDRLERDRREMAEASEQDDTRLRALKQEISRMGEMWRAAEFDGEPK